ncbi:MAG: cell division protein FtsQ/DivIB, partial [Lachnospiraceae bacterium]|nr:cell division protein FtsQ/DivIB [Lachnospiraceae bacterium]
VTLHVYDKTISGCIRYMGQYVYFDKDGIVLQSLSEHKNGVPIVTGIMFGDFTVGKAFDVDDDSLFEAIMNVSQLISYYNIDVSQIHVNKGEITIYSGKVRVILGKKKMYDDQMTALSSVLKTTSEKDMAGVIDMVNYKSGDKIILKTYQNNNNKKKNSKKEE